MVNVNRVFIKLSQCTVFADGHTKVNSKVFLFTPNALINNFNNKMSNGNRSTNIESVY